MVVQVLKWSAVNPEKLDATVFVREFDQLLKEV